MKLTSLILAFNLLLIADDGEKYLSRIALYQKDSYFKKKVYEEHDYQSFYRLKEANEIINPNVYDIHLLNASVFYATNKLRESKGLKALKFSEKLRDVAMVHSHEMVEKNFFDHYNNKNVPLKSPEDRMKLFDIDADEEAENIDNLYIEMPGKVSYFQLAEKIVNELYHSPPHRKNMLDKTFTSLGCGAMFEEKERDGLRYVKTTQDFIKAHP